MRYYIYSLSVASISQSNCSCEDSLKTKRWKQAELDTYSDLNWRRSLVLKLRSRVMAWFAYLDCRGWRSGLLWRHNCPHMTAWKLIGSICTTRAIQIARRVRRNWVKKLWQSLQLSHSRNSYWYCSHAQLIIYTCMWLINTCLASVFA